MFRRLPRLSCFALVLAFSTQALGQQASADLLFDQARTLMDSGDYAAAATKLEESERLDPAAGTLLNLAECYVQLGRTASAWTAYREAASLARSHNQPDREAFAISQGNAIAAKLSKVTIVVPESSRVEGLAIRRNDVGVPAALWGTQVPVDPGAVHVTASAPGHEPWSTDDQLPEGGAVLEITVPALAPEEAEAAPPPTAAPPPAPIAESRPVPAKPVDQTKESSSIQPLVGWVLTGIGGITLGVAGGFFIDSRSQFAASGCTNGQCLEAQGDDKEAHDAGRKAEVTAAVLAGAGAALVGTGFVLVLTGQSSDETAELYVRPTTSGFSLGMTHRY